MQFLVVVPSFGRRVRPRRVITTALFALEVALLICGVLVGSVAANAEAIADPVISGLTPDVAAALQEAAATDARVRIGSMDTEQSTTYANPSGSFTDEQTSEPTRVEQDGVLTDVDTTLVVRTGGTIVPEATTIDTTIGPGGTDELFSVKLGNGVIRYRWPTTLPAPALSANTVTYRAVKPGVDLVLTVDNLRVETTLIVASAAAATEVEQVHILEDMDGLQQRVDQAGNSVFVADGTEVAFSSAPRAWEAKIDAAEPQAVSLDRTIYRDDGSPVADDTLVQPATEVVTTPAAFLQSSATTYPVTIDPSVNPAISAFSYTDSAFPNQSYVNDGWDRSRVHVGRNPADSSSLTRAYFSFRGVNLGTVSIEHAELNTVLDYTSYPTPTATNLYATTGWGTALTWANQPPDPGTGSATTFVDMSDAYQAYNTSAVSVGFDIGNYINTHQNMANFFFMLRATDENSITHWKKFRSAATMSITYNSFPGPPTNLRYATPRLACDSDDGRPSINRSMLAGGFLKVAANATDPDRGSPYVTFTLERQLKGQQTWATVKTVSTGRQASGTDFGGSFASNLLTDGSYVRFAAASMSSAGNSDGNVYACKVEVDFTAPSAPAASASEITGVIGQAVAPGLKVSEGSTADGDLRCFAYSLSSTRPIFPTNVLDNCRHSGTTGNVVYSDSGYTVVHASTEGDVSLKIAPRGLAGTLYIWAIDNAMNMSTTARAVRVIGQSDTAAGSRQHTWNTDTAQTATATIADSTSSGNTQRPFSIPAGSGIVTSEPAPPFAHGGTGLLRMNSGSVVGSATTSGMVVGGAGRLTMGAWAYPRPSDGHSHVLMQQTAGSGASAQLLQYSDGRWRACIFATTRDDSIRSTCVVSSSAAVANQWTYVSLTYDDVNRQLWLRANDVNGSQDEGAAYLPPGDTAIAADGPLLIGAPSYYWMGSVARPYIVNSVLSEVQLDNISRGRAIDDDNTGGGDPGPAFASVPSNS